MGGGTGAGGQDSRWLKLQKLQDEVTALLEDIKNHAPTVEDYGVHYPRRPLVPPKPAERMDCRPGPPPPPPGSGEEFKWYCCWKAKVWPWHKRCTRG